MDDLTRDLFIRGMMAAKANEKADAQRYLEWLLRLDPPQEMRVDALYWLSKVAETPEEEQRLLEEALAYDPSEMRCRRALAVARGELNPAEIVDPDRLGQPQKETAQAPQAAEAGRFICPQCGGRMTYTPDGQSLTCEYCAATPPRGARYHPDGGTGSAKPGGARSAESDNFLIAMATRKGHLRPVMRQTFTCQGCGIPFLLPAQQLSVTCPYCGSAYTVRSVERRELIDPQLILPFTVEREQAEQAIADWLAPARGARGAAEKASEVERAAAIYLPAWSFEMAGQVPWRCMVEEQRDRWVSETGSEIVYHASVLVPASTRLSAECAEELRAFDLKQAVRFEERYLADWMAETYQITVGDASLEARRWTYEFEKESVRQRMVRRVKDLTFNSLGITIEAFQLALLPVWLGHYRLGERRFEVVVNGRSGAVRGQRPQGWLEKLLKI